MPNVEGEKNGCQASPSIDKHCQAFSTSSPRKTPPSPQNTSLEEELALVGRSQALEGAI